MAFVAKSIYSFKGFMKSFFSKDFYSREDARKYSPFFDDDYSLLYWVNSSYDPDSKKRTKRSHFRHYPKRALTFKKSNKELSIKKSKDNKHKVAQNIILDVLNKHIKKNESLEWFYKDERLSEFSISGNLLKYVETVKKEHIINILPLKLDYCFDIVLLGQKANNEDIILGAIEIENTHEAEFLKILVCKSLGFPLLTIDISEYSENDINEELCKKLLLETTMDNAESRRRNNNWDFDEGHQYIIFTKNEADIEKLKFHINMYKNSYNFNEKMYYSRLEILIKT